MTSTKGLVRQEGFHPTNASNDDWRPPSTVSSSVGIDESDFDIPRTHNIFDMGVNTSASSRNNNTPPPLGLPSIPAHFNSTLPALNSSMRYEPLPGPEGSPGRAPSPSPHPSSTTPVPTTSGNHPYAGPGVSRSRSRSRPPSAFSPASPNIPNSAFSGGGNLGPQRTNTRSRRGNSVSSLSSNLSSTSPPPIGGPASAAQAILIPRGSSASGNPDGWFGPGSHGSMGSLSSSAGPGEFTLPTPESLVHSQQHHSHSSQSHHHSNSTTHGFANLSLNVSNLNPPGIHNQPLNSPLTHNNNQFGFSGNAGFSGAGAGMANGHWPSSPNEHHYAAGNGSPFDTIPPPHGQSHHHQHHHQQQMNFGFGGGMSSNGHGGHPSHHNIGSLGSLGSALGMGSIGSMGMDTSSGWINAFDSGAPPRGFGLGGGGGGGGSNSLSSSLPTSMASSSLALPPPSSQSSSHGRAHSHSVSSGSASGGGATGSTTTSSSTTTTKARRNTTAGDSSSKAGASDNPKSSSSSSSAAATAAALKHLSPAEKQAFLANEKRRRRRESHNAVERRRRDNINEKIGELATLIPDVMFGSLNSNVKGADGASPPPDGNNNTILPLSPTSPGGGPGSPISPTFPTSSSYGFNLDGMGLPVPDEYLQQNGLNNNGNGGGQLKTEPMDTDDVNAAGEGGNGKGGDKDDGGVVKANKGMILRKSVEYIRYLQQLVTAQGARNRELERELKAYREGTAVPNSSGLLQSGTPPSSSNQTDANAPQDHVNEMGDMRMFTSHTGAFDSMNGFNPGSMGHFDSGNLSGGMQDMQGMDMNNFGGMNNMGFGLGGMDGLSVGVGSNLSSSSSVSGNVNSGIGGGMSMGSPLSDVDEDDEGQDHKDREAGKKDVNMKKDVPKVKPDPDAVNEEVSNSNTKAVAASLPSPGASETSSSHSGHSRSGSGSATVGGSGSVGKSTRTTRLRNGSFNKPTLSSSPVSASTVTATLTSKDASSVLESRGRPRRARRGSDVGGKAEVLGGKGTFGNSGSLPLGGASKGSVSTSPAAARRKRVTAATTKSSAVKGRNGNAEDIDMDSSIVDDHDDEALDDKDDDPDYHDDDDEDGDSRGSISGRGSASASPREPRERREDEHMDMDDVGDGDESIGKRVGGRTTRKVVVGDEMEF